MKKETIPFNNEEHFEAYQNKADKERLAAIEKMPKNIKKKFKEIESFLQKLIEYRIPFNFSMLAPDPDGNISPIFYSNFAKMQFEDVKLGSWVSQKLILDFFYGVGDCSGGYYGGDVVEKAIDYLNKAQDELRQDKGEREKYSREELEKIWNK